MTLSTRTLRPFEICALTGLSGNQFGELVRQLWEIRPDRGRGRPWSMSFPDRVLATTMYLRTNLTERALAVLFDTTDSTIDRVVHDLAGPIGTLLGPAPTDRRELWLVDGTLIPARDRTRGAKSKNYRRSVNVQVVSRARDGRVVAVGDAWPGNRNDSVVFRATVASVCRGHPRVSADGAYRGVDGVRSPRRGPDGRIVRDRAYRRFRKTRARVEHVIARLKLWAVLRDIRQRGDRVDELVRAVAALHNLRLDVTS